MTVVTLACETDVDREVVKGLQHLPHVDLARRASRCVRAGAVPLSASHVPGRIYSSSYLGPAPPPSNVVTPEQTDSYACWGQMV